GARTGSGYASVRVERTPLFIDPSTGKWVYGPAVAGYVYQVPSVRYEESHTASVWARRVSGAVGLALQVRNPSTGDWQTLAAIGAGDSVPDYAQLSGRFESLGVDVEFRVTGVLAGTTTTGEWYIDDASLEEDMAAKRREIEAAIASTLEGITTAAGYSTTVQTVQRGLRGDPAKLDMPTLLVFWDGPESKEVAALHRKRGTVHFTVRCAMRSEGDAGRDAIQDLAGDVETILETQTDGKYIGLGYIDDLYVSEIDPWEAGVDGHPELNVIDVLVTVVYEHNRTAP
ncbi:MAG: hypothetical protein Q9Q40_14145, partial [Acidobacteriota bacterium]|nr:hypothetical protein [Acidobacteriota bacterium]